MAEFSPLGSGSFARTGIQQDREGRIDVVSTLRYWTTAASRNQVSLRFEARNLDRVDDDD